MSANRLNADNPKSVTRGRLIAEAVEELGAIENKQHSIKPASFSDIMIQSDAVF